MNENKRIARKTRLLFGFWCTMYALFDITSSVYVSYQQVINGTDPTTFLSGFQLATLAIIALLFFPSLIGIYLLTKKYDSKKLRKVVLGLLVILSIWLVAMMFCTVGALMIPGFMA